MTNVCRLVLLSRLRSVLIWSAPFESKLPVGSSAQMIAGRLMRRARSLLAVVDRHSVQMVYGLPTRGVRRLQACPMLGRVPPFRQCRRLGAAAQHSRLPLALGAG